MSVFVVVVVALLIWLLAVVAVLSLCRAAKLADERAERLWLSRQAQEPACDLVMEGVGDDNELRSRVAEAA